MSDDKKLPERIRHVDPEDFDEDRFKAGKCQSGKVYLVVRMDEKGLVCVHDVGKKEVILPLDECMDQHGRERLEL